MDRLICRFFILLFSLWLALPAARADSASLLHQASAANPARYEFATNNNAEIRNTSDNKAFTLWWQPATGTPTGVVVTLHGHGAYATDEFYLWQPYLQARGYAMLALQWWFGGGDATADYYEPQQMYSIIASLLKEKGVQPGTVLLHGYSRGSANSYAVTALDTSSGNRYINMTLSNAGGATANYPPNQQIVAGAFGVLPFSGVQWVMYCGGLDPDPTINGCPAMISAQNWVTQYGAIVKLLITDATGGHGGFMLNSTNVNTALAGFAPSPRTPTAASTADCIFHWAEGTFAQYFAPAGGASQTSTPYYFRYYAGTGNYLASNTADNHLWALGPATGGNLLDLGPATGFLASSGCTAP